MVQEQSDQIWASFMNALNKLGSLNTYTELITILKTPLDSIKKEIGWKEKYAPIIKDLHALENFIVMMITEIKSFAATASRYYGNIKDQLKIIDDIFKVNLFDFIDLRVSSPLSNLNNFELRMHEVVCSLRTKRNRSSM